MPSGTQPAVPDLNLGRRRGSLAGAVSRARAALDGPTVELDCRPLTAGAGGSRADPGSGGVLAVCVLWSSRWDAAALARLSTTLAAGQPLILVEPVADLGWRRLVQWLLTPWWRLRLGHAFNRDLPVDLRAAGFALTDIDRFAAGRSGIRTYVYSRAVVKRS